MPRYFCDYCDTYLTHDSPSVRKTHNSGRKHKENVRLYYQQWMEEQAQKLVDATTKAFQQGKISGQFPGSGAGRGAMVPPPGAMMRPGGGPPGPMPPMMRPGMPPMPMPGMMPGMPMGPMGMRPGMPMPPRG